MHAIARVPQDGRLYREVGGYFIVPQSKEGGSPNLALMAVPVGFRSTGLWSLILQIYRHLHRAFFRLPLQALTVNLKGLLPLGFSRAILAMLYT